MSIVCSGVGRLAFLGTLASAILLLGPVPGESAAYAQSATVSGGSWSFVVGSTGTVQITISGLPAEGLGAADVSVAFNPSVLKIVACDTGALGGACNTNAPGGPAHAAGFALPAITGGPVAIATLTFDCVGTAGSSSTLNITVNELIDGSPGNAKPISAAVQNGAVVCSAPPTPPPPPSPQTPTPEPTPTPTPTPTTTPTPAPPAKIDASAQCASGVGNVVVLTIRASGFEKGTDISLYLFPERVRIGELRDGRGPKRITAVVGSPYRSVPLTIAVGRHTITANVRDPAQEPRDTFVVPQCDMTAPTPLSEPTGGGDSGGILWVAFGLALPGAFAVGVAGTVAGRYAWRQWLLHRRALA